MGVFQAYCCSRANVWEAGLEGSGPSLSHTFIPLRKKFNLCTSALEEDSCAKEREYN